MLKLVECFSFILLHIINYQTIGKHDCDSDYKRLIKNQIIISRMKIDVVVPIPFLNDGRLPPLFTFSGQNIHFFLSLRIILLLTVSNKFNFHTQLDKPNNMSFAYITKRIPCPFLNGPTLAWDHAIFFVFIAWLNSYTSCQLN